VFAAESRKSLIINLFYEEPENDRWLPFDRYPRRIARRLLRGRPWIGGHQLVFRNICAGLDRIGIAYRVNDYARAKHNPGAVACIVGKPCVLAKMEWKNPILFGASVFSHPSDDPRLLERLPVKKILVPCGWMKDMWKPVWDEPVAVWPVGIDVDRWQPADVVGKRYDVLIYDKLRWDRDYYEKSLIDPIRRVLRAKGHAFREIRYGFYGCHGEEAFRAALAECRTMIFLCEHETQGIAYQQALSSGVPILAWDRGGYWRDPAYFPHRVQFGPVSSVPYWDDRCGRTFASIQQFDDAWGRFWDEFQSGRYRPRSYILENLTLEKCAHRYVHHVCGVGGC
jgi:glycosyltransferase involved in cell wall biosynthesis